jgi:2-polyprenyl-3-methyl-5-hydroxy-6-metoxy-1,4-benzoquinol methylase
MKKTADNFFSETAEDFDLGYSCSQVFKERYQVWTSLWPKYLPVTGQILDLGCGSGIFSFALASRGYFVTGVDGAPNMIALCNKKMHDLHQNKVNFITSKIPFDKNLFSNPFDVIISSSVLEYIEDIDKVLADVAFLLKPNGVFMVSMPNSHALYRNLEKISWKLFHRPKYMKYVQHVVERNDFNSKVNGHGFELMYTQFYGRQNRLTNILPEANASTLFVSVFKKKNILIDNI